MWNGNCWSNLMVSLPNVSAYVAHQVAGYFLLFVVPDWENQKLVEPILLWNNVTSTWQNINVNTTCIWYLLPQIAYFDGEIMFSCWNATLSYNIKHNVWIEINFEEGAFDLEKDSVLYLLRTTFDGFARWAKELQFLTFDLTTHASNSTSSISVFGYASELIMCGFGNSLFVSGYFYQIGDVDTPHSAAVFNGQTWIPVDIGNFTVMCCTGNDTNVIVLLQEQDNQILSLSNTGEVQYFVNYTTSWNPVEVVAIGIDLYFVTFSGFFCRILENRTAEVSFYIFLSDNLFAGT
jgi:hypothetical protein